MRGNFVKIYKYSRGDKYSCQVAIINGDHVVFHNMKVPVDASEEVVCKMMDDAEEEAWKLYNVEMESKYSGT